MKLVISVKTAGAASLVCWALLLLPARSVAHNSTSQTLESVKETQPGNIGRWIDELADDASSVRDNARKNLVAAALKAVKPLKEAAVNGDPQTAYSSVRLLAELMRDNDKPTAAAAKQAVTEIAQGKSPSARQANKVLEEKAETPGIAGSPNPPWRRSVSISRSQINDSERVVVQDGDRRIEILREPKRIVVNIKDEDGKESVFKAESEAELKKASPLAAELVDKYLNQNGPQIGIGQAGFNQLPFGPLGKNRIPPGLFLRRRPGQKDSVQEMARLLGEVKDIAKTAQQDRDVDKLQQIIDKLEHLETHLEILRLERGQ